MRIALFFIIIFLIINKFGYSCCRIEENLKERSSKQGGEIELKKVIPVPESLQAFFLPDAICYFTYGEVDYLCIFSPIEKSIIFFNLKSQKVDRTIVPQDSLHKIKRPVGLYVHSIDTIVLLEQETQHLIVLNARGEITEEIDVKWDSGLSPHPPAPQLSMSNPLCIVEDYIYMAGYSGGEFHDEKTGSRPVIIRIGPNREMKSYLADYPEIYYRHIWGGLNYRFLYHTIHEEKGLLVMSFPATGDIFYYSVSEGKMCKVPQVVAFSQRIRPFRKRKIWYGSLAKQDYTIHYYRNYSFQAIYWDPYRKVYYRFGEKPNSSFDYCDYQSYYKEKTLFILDEKLAVSFECSLPSDYYKMTEYAFVTRDGLCILLYHPVMDSFYIGVYEINVPIQ